MPCFWWYRDHLQFKSSPVLEIPSPYMINKGFLKWWSHLPFHDLDLGFLTDIGRSFNNSSLICVLLHEHPNGLKHKISEHVHLSWVSKWLQLFHATVDKDSNCFGLIDRSTKLAHGLTHHTSLQPTWLPRPSSLITARGVQWSGNWVDNDKVNPPWVNHSFSNFDILFTLSLVVTRVPRQCSLPSGLQHRLCIDKGCTSPFLSACATAWRAPLSYQMILVHRFRWYVLR